MSKDLIPKIITPSEVFVPNGLDVILIGIKNEVSKEKAKSFDINNEKDRDARKSFAYQIKRSKTFVDDKGKKYVAELKRKPKEVDAERKRFRDKMDEIWADVRKPLTDYETAEAAKAEKRRQQELLKLDHEEALTMDDLFNREREVKRKEAEFARIEEERLAEEEEARIETERLEREERLKKEAIEQAELKAAEAVKIERSRLVSVKNEAKEAAAQAERDKIAAIEQAKKDKQAAINLAIRQAEERARLEKEKAERKTAEEKALADKKAANKKHQAEINNQILNALKTAGISQDVAKKVICVVAKKQIPYMVIQY